jgi:hypothetical protein
MGSCAAPPLPHDLRLFPLQGCEIRLDLVVLCDLAFDIVINANKFLRSYISAEKTTLYDSTDLLQ